MESFIAIVHLFVAVGLVILVLLQDSKGGAMGALTGGGSNTVFGSTGAANFLVKLTRGFAVVFAITSIYLAASTGGGSKSVIDDEPPVSSQPATATTEKVETSKAASPEADKDTPKKTDQ